MSAKIIWTLTLLMFWCNYGVSSERSVICYYSSWATYRSSNGKFDVENINPFLCTHLIYCFAGIDHQGAITSLDSYLDLPFGRDNFGIFNRLKLKNPQLKTLLAVGGWNEGSGKYSIMAANSTFRDIFIKSALDMTLAYGFDGIDLDWEYPNRRDSVYGRDDVINFSTLVKELQSVFYQHGRIVTAAVASVEDSAALSYNIKQISKYLDMIHVMTYDMYGPWGSVTGHNAPLHKAEGADHISAENFYSVDVAMNYWLEQGAPAEKLAIGIPFYGRSFFLSNSSRTGVGAPATGPGISGPYTVTAGLVGYNEFCEIAQTEQWSMHYDVQANVPYAVKGKNWVSFDNADSISDKVKWGLHKNITNYMIWSIETDDFTGTCGEKFPLLKAVNRLVWDNTDATTEDNPLQPNITPPTATAGTLGPDPLPSHICEELGTMANPADCTSFLMCVADISGHIYPIIFYCPDNLYFNPESLTCDFPDAVKCTV